MRIISIDKIVSERITTDESDWNVYIRYGPDAWECEWGCSMESVFSPKLEEIESLYQEFKRNSMGFIRGGG